MGAKTEILNLLNRVHSCVEKGDIEVMQLLDEEMNAIGTNEDEIMLDKDQFYRLMKKQFEQQEIDDLQIKIDLDNISIRILAENVGYSMSYGTLLIGSPSGDFSANLRETLVFNKIDNEWRVSHMNWSFPFTGAEEDVPFPKLEVLSDNISNWLKRLEINTPTLLINNQDKKEELIKYLKQAKAILEVENIS